MCDKQYILISIEGNVGAGKSTIIQHLKNHFPHSVILDEPLQSWQQLTQEPNTNLLQKYYDDPKRWAYTFQLYAYQSRVMQWDQQIQEYLKHIKNNHKQIIFISERSIESAKQIFFNLCVDQGFINPIEQQVYEQFYEWFLKKHQEYCVDKIIYIDTPPDECLRRIHTRGRQEENNINLEYLTQLDRYHKSWIQNINNYIIIDGTKQYKIQNILDYLK